MFWADVELVKRVHAQYGCHGPVVDAGGFSSPCIADYQRTIDAMAALDPRAVDEGYLEEKVAKAQWARYLTIERPFSFLGDYEIENPEAGGKKIEQLSNRHYGTILCFSVLEHTPSPQREAYNLAQALKHGGLLVLSVPFQFPYHDSIDYWRMSPDALRVMFADWDILECDWHLRIAADAGVKDIKNGKPQAVEASYIVARAR